MKTLVGMTFFFLVLVSQAVHGEPLLKGSKESQIKQNAVADAYDLVRIKNNAELEEMKATGRLVRIPDTPGIKVDKRLPEHLRFVLPWVSTFLVETGSVFYWCFGGKEIQINSAVRTAEYQIHLIKKSKNPNAASVTGPKRSVHLTGSAIDIAKLPLTERQKLWLREWLVGLEIVNAIEATEEHNQAVFHLMVFPDYGSSPIKTASQ